MKLKNVDRFLATKHSINHQNEHFLIVCNAGAIHAALHYLTSIHLV